MEKYKIILADPAWKYNDRQKNMWSWAESHYNVMSTEEMCWLDIKSISDKDSVCCMWVTMPMLPDGIQLMKAWWFKYKTVLFNWVKKYPKKDEIVKGLGHYTRSNSEICIIWVRGKWLPVLDRTISQIVIEPRGRHSVKPTSVRDNIVKLFWDKKRIELFARESSEWWDVVWDELGITIEKFIRNFKS